MTQNIILTAYTFGPRESHRIACFHRHANHPPGRRGLTWTVVLLHFGHAASGAQPLGASSLSATRKMS